MPASRPPRVAVVIEACRGETTPEDPLSPRELEVVKLIAEWLAGMRNRVELARYAIRRGLVVP
jgi:hypothetical protein